MPAAYSLTCPACGNPFLATLGEATTITTCPHCAFNGPVQSFAAAGIDRLGSTPSIPLRRREVRHRQVEQGPPSATPPVVAAAPLFPEIPPQPGGHQDHQARHFSPTSHPVGAPLSHHIPAHPAPTPLTPAYPQMASPQLAPHQSSDNLPNQPTARPRNLPIGKIILFLLAFGVIAAGAVFVYWELRQEFIRNRASDIAQAPRPTTGAEEPSTDPTPPALEVRPALPASAPLSLPPPDPELERNILSAEAPDFMISVFNASEAERHRFLHGSSQNDPSLKDFFTRDPPVTLGALKRLPVAPIDLVRGGEVSLFQVTSSANPIGALARISRDPDGALKLHWPFFVETHDAVLNHYIETESLVQPAWFHVGIRRSHGLDLSEELRGTHFIFDVQASATGLLGTHIVAAKELPPGRFIDQKSTWQTVYLCHLLLQKKPLTNGNRVLEVLDCAGASLTR